MRSRGSWRLRFRCIAQSMVASSGVPASDWRCARSLRLASRDCSYRGNSSTPHGSSWPSSRTAWCHWRTKAARSGGVIRSRCRAAKPSPCSHRALAAAGREVTTTRVSGYWPSSLRSQSRTARRSRSSSSSTPSISNSACPSRSWRSTQPWGMIPVIAPATPSSMAPGAGIGRPLYSRSLTRTGVSPFQSTNSPWNVPRAAITASQRSSVVLPEPASPRSSTRFVSRSAASTRMPELSSPPFSQLPMSGRGMGSSRMAPRRRRPLPPVARRLT